ncbi:hypothetical protein [Paenibacillus sp. Soil750]|uniref:hypothetical protein n=1 Tax=Paenibacillus sp. Soil750 TaxID=1736398 RepID=UPI0006F85EB1|nr:hypothetical protein [Paenibacillus sp. Soil750]KRE58144.1 hypothetical protein ASL11_27610 [Paenibacillus sp. Soil750]
MKGNVSAPFDSKAAERSASVSNYWLLDLGPWTTRKKGSQQIGSLFCSNPIYPRYPIPQLI